MNGFYGSLPMEIKAMKNLKELILFGNYFSSTIPTYLAELKKLRGTIAKRLMVYHVYQP